jgi:hypothetical protein
MRYLLLGLIYLLLGSPVGTQEYIVSGAAAARRGPGFAPTDLSNLLVFVENNTVSEGDLDDVTSWEDQSGNSADFDEVTNPPQANTLGGMKVVQFNGPTDILISPDQAGYSGASLSLSFVQRIDGSDVFIEVAQWEPTGNKRCFIFQWAAGTPDKLKMNLSSDGTTQARVAVDADFVTSPATIYKVHIVYDGSQGTELDRVKFWVDGVEQTTNKTVETGTVPTSLANVDQTVAMGATRAGTGHSSNQMAAVLIRNAVHSTDDISDLDDWFDDNVLP